MTFSSSISYPISQALYLIHKLYITSSLHLHLPSCMWPNFCNKLLGQNKWSIWGGKGFRGYEASMPRCVSLVMGKQPLVTASYLQTIPQPLQCTLGVVQCTALEVYTRRVVQCTGGEPWRTVHSWYIIVHCTKCVLRKKLLSPNSLAPPDRWGESGDCYLLNILHVFCTFCPKTKWTQQRKHLEQKMENKHISACSGMQEPENLVIIARPKSRRF